MSRLCTVTKLIFRSACFSWHFLKTGGNTPIMSEDSRDVDIRENAAHTKKLTCQTFLEIYRKAQHHNNLLAARHFWQGSLADSQPKCGCVCLTQAWTITLIFFCHLKLDRETMKISPPVLQCILCKGHFSATFSLSLIWRMCWTGCSRTPHCQPHNQISLLNRAKVEVTANTCVSTGRMKLWKHALIQPCPCLFELSDDAINSQCCLVEMCKS